MPPTILHRLVLSILSASLVSLGIVQSAAGAVVSTEQAMQLEDRAQLIDRINSTLAERQIREQLVAMGVDPQEAESRVAALSDGELVLLDQQLAGLPAGAGALEVLGIVLLVLLVLELVGVTDIFKSL